MNYSLSTAAPSFGIGSKVWDFFFKKFPHLFNDIFFHLANPLPRNPVSITDFLQCYGIVGKNPQIKYFDFARSHFFSEFSNFVMQ